MTEKMFNEKPLGGLSKTRNTALTAMLFAVALVLSVIENMLPPLPIAVPGVKFGLANVAVMYALFFLGAKQAYLIAILKGGFGYITRGAVAGALSLCGGLLSVTVMLLLLTVFRKKISYLILSVFGAVSHNVGQFFVIMLIYTGLNIWPYLPVLLISGVIAGIATSTLLRFILPALKSISSI